jgi:hypothetical protein
MTIPCARESRLPTEQLPLLHASIVPSPNSDQAVPTGSHLRHLRCWIYWIQRLDADDVYEKLCRHLLGSSRRQATAEAVCESAVSIYELDLGDGMPHSSDRRPRCLPHSFSLGMWRSGEFSRELLMDRCSRVFRLMCPDCVEFVEPNLNIKTTICIDIGRTPKEGSRA